MTGNKRRRSVRLTASYIALIALALISIYPALWIVLGSFRQGGSLYSESLIPREFTMDNYKELFTSDTFMFSQWYMNTLKIAFISMLIGTLLALLCGYAVSRFRFRGRKSTLTSILVLNMFPSFMTLIALFILLKELNLLNTHAAIILVYAAGAPVMGTLVVKGFFDSLPSSLDESARIDGANHLTVFTRITLPLSRPLLAYMMITSFVGPWLDFIFARMVLRSREKWTLAVGLFNLINNNQTTNFTLFAAASVLISIPITLLFIILQRYFSDGLTAGASKG